jgi:large subunit ribosomal protein L28
MANRCELTGKSPLTANRVSHANNRVKCRLNPNIQNKKYWIPELRRNVTLRLSTSAIKTISKRGGITSAILQEKVERLSPRLQALRKAIQKPRRASAKPAAQ